MRSSSILISLFLVGAALPAAEANLLSNADFEAATGAAPTDWPMPSGTTWEVEKGNHFLRLRANSPGASVTVYRQMPIAANTKLTLTGRFRWTDVVRGNEKWNDGRLLVEFKSADGKKCGSAPAPLIFVGSSNGWQERQVAIVVPSEAVTLAVMPALFQVAGGTLDLDDLRLVITP